MELEYLTPATTLKLANWGNPIIHSSLSPDINIMKTASNIYKIIFGRSIGSRFVNLI